MERESPKQSYKHLNSEDLIAAIDAAHKGTGVTAVCWRLLKDLSEKLNAARSELHALASEIAHQTDAIESARPTIEMLASSIRSEVVEFRGAIRSLRNQLDETNRALNSVVMKLGIATTSSPDIWMTILTLVILLFIEAFSTGSIFYADGAVPDEMTALLLGFVISATNVGISAVLGGFICGRNVNYDACSIQPRRGAKLRRTAAWTGTAIVVGVLGWFHLTVGVVRATGDFDNMAINLDTLAAVGQSFYAQLAIVLGILTSAIAWLKGLYGFASRDPVSAALQARADELLNEAHDLHDEFQNTVRDLWDEAIEEIDECKEGGQEDDERREEYQTKEAELIDLIRQAEIDYETAAAEASAAYRKVDKKANGESEPFAAPKEFWERFMPDWAVPEKVMPDSDKAQALHDQIAQTADNAFSDVERIWSEFHDQPAHPHHADETLDPEEESLNDGDEEEAFQPA